jgi:hypothetical protein
VNSSAGSPRLMSKAHRTLCSAIGPRIMPRMIWSEGDVHLSRRYPASPASSMTQRSIGRLLMT